MSIEIMYKHFICIWAAGILLSFCCGLLGPFIIWRKMSSFGNTLSHASLLGLACALYFNINTICAVLMILILLTIIIIYIEHISNLPLDTILGIITYSSLSIGMIIIHTISKNENTDLTKYLLGDLSKLTLINIGFIFIMTIIISSVISIFWRAMLLTIINIELAQIKNINIFNIRLILMILVTFLIGISTTLIGSLLISAILIIPPAITQKFSNSPEKMVIFSIFINMISITVGITVAVYYNIPISPTVILIESMIFLISIIYKNKN